MLKTLFETPALRILIYTPRNKPVWDSITLELYDPYGVTELTKAEVQELHDVLGRLLERWETLA